MTDNELQEIEIEYFMLRYKPNKTNDDLVRMSILYEILRIKFGTLTD